MKKAVHIKCYLCGKLGADTKDHIPPKAIFKEVTESNSGYNLITVPAHKDCNNKYQKDDELFRAFLTIICPENSNAQRLWNKKIVSSFNNKKNSIKQALLNRLIDINYSVDDQSTIYTDKGITLETGLINRQIERIVKGIYFHHIEKPLIQKVVNQEFIGDNDFYNHISLELQKHGIKSGWQIIVPGVFKYFFRLAYDDLSKGLVLLNFYDEASFFVTIE